MKSNMFFLSRLGLVLVVMLLTGNAATLTSLWSKNKSKKRKMRPNDGYTPKEHCIRKVIYLYKKHFIKWYAKHKAQKKIMTSFKTSHQIENLKKYATSRRLYLRSYRRRGHCSRRYRRYYKHHRTYRRRRRHHRYRRRHRRIRHHRRAKKTHFLNVKLKRSFLFRKRFLVKYLLHHWKDTLSKRKFWLYHELKSLDSMNTLLFYSKSLPKMYRMRLKRCKLNMKPALKRCESLYSKGNCEQISDTLVSKKCPKGKLRVGCCSCASPCPSKMFKTAGFYCIRERVYNLDKFKSKKECERMNKNQACRMVVEKEMNKVLELWVPGCKKGFMNEGSKCRVACPEGYSVGRKGRCVRKGIVSLGTPFTWIKSDK